MELEKKRDLFRTVGRGEMDAVLRLLDQGADLEACDARGRTLLHAAAAVADVRLVRELISRGATARSVDGRGTTPLIAVSVAPEGTPADRCSIARMLLEAGADVTHGDGAALRAAARQGDTDLVALLLDAGADPDAPCGAGYTSLHYASRLGHADVVAVLLAAGADPNARVPFHPDNRRRYGDTPISLALWWRHLDIVEQLLAHGAVSPE